MSFLKPKVTKTISVNSLLENSTKKKLNIPFSVFGSDTFFSGKLILKGEARIAGKIEGSIFSEDVLIIEETAHVNGEVKGVVVEINGSFEGKIEVSGVLRLASTAKIKGDIIAMRLIVEEGAKLKGNIVSADSAKNLEDINPSLVVGHA